MGFRNNMYDEDSRTDRMIFDYSFRDMTQVYHPDFRLENKKYSTMNEKAKRKRENDFRLRMKTAYTGKNDT
jgi:hypothetical protein